MDFHYDPLYHVDPVSDSDEPEQSASNDSGESSSYFKLPAISTSSFFSSFSSIVDSVKQKSEDIINIYKEDLQGFGSSLNNEAAETLHRDRPASQNQQQQQQQQQQQRNADSDEPLQQLKILKSKISSSITSFIGEYPAPESTPSTTTAATIASPSSLSSPALQNNLSNSTSSIPLDDSFKLFLNDPVNEIEEFTAFKQGFSLPAYREKIIELLTANNSYIQKYYNQLVPQHVNELNFWSRYFFNVQFNKDEPLRKIKALSETLDNDEDVKWEDDTTITDVTEEQVEQVTTMVSELDIPPTTTTTTTTLDNEQIENDIQQQETNDEQQIIYSDNNVETITKSDEDDHHNIKEVTTSSDVDIDNSSVNSNEFLNNNNDNNNNSSLKENSSFQEVGKVLKNGETLSDWEVIDKKFSTSDEDEWSAWE